MKTRFYIVLAAAILGSFQITLFKTKSLLEIAFHHLALMPFLPLAASRKYIFLQFAAVAIIVFQRYSCATQNSSILFHHKIGGLPGTSVILSNI
jgi:hypothetical protein